MSRQLRSVLPSTHQQLQPKVVSSRDVHARRVHQQQQQKTYYDRSARPRSLLQEGQHIRIQEQGQWKPAVVIRAAETDRSYHIRSAEGGQEYRRNRRHLLSTKEHHTHIDKLLLLHRPPMNLPLLSPLTRQDPDEKSSLELFWTCNTM